MTRVAVIAALPGELAPLVRGWRRDRVAGVPRWRRAADGLEWVAACAGTGAGAAARAYAAAAAGGPPQRVISVGWAGALTAAQPAGAACAVGTVIDAATGERFAAATPGCILATTDRVAGADEKRRLAATGADLVDMEAAAVARLARRDGASFVCIKGISDAWDDPLPDFNPFIGPDGHFHVARLVAHAALRPGWWPGLVRLGRQSRRAAESIRRAVLALPSP
jgi:adenosylhomocysteine nucleosidase